jgi:lambda repressor-like predicted transcriptional regulator
MAIAIMYNGKEYPSITALSKELGINYETLRGRIKRKKPLDAPINNKAAGISISCDNKEYSSLRELSKETGINYETLLSRKKKGQKLTAPVRKYHSNKEVKKGHDLIISSIRIPGIGKPCMDHKGNLFPSFTAMCEAYGQKVERVRQRIYVLNWSLKDALEEGATKMPEENISVEHSTIPKEFFMEGLFHAELAKNNIEVALDAETLRRMEVTKAKRLNEYLSKDTGIVYRKVGNRKISIDCSGISYGDILKDEAGYRDLIGEKYTEIKDTVCDIYSLPSNTTIRPVQGKDGRWYVSQQELDSVAI